MRGFQALAPIGRFAGLWENHHPSYTTTTALACTMCSSFVKLNRLQNRSFGAFFFRSATHRPFASNETLPCVHIHKNTVRMCCNAFFLFFSFLFFYSDQCKVRGACHHWAPFQV